MVGGEPQAILCDVDVHLVCEIDGLEKLVQRPRGAGNCPEDWRKGRRALRVHGGAGVEGRARETYSASTGRLLGNAQNRLGFKCYGTASARGLGILDVDSDRTEHVNHTKPATGVRRAGRVGDGGGDGNRRTQEPAMPGQRARAGSRLSGLRRVSSA